MVFEDKCLDGDQIAEELFVSALVSMPPLETFGPSELGVVCCQEEDLVVACLEVSDFYILSF